MSTKTKHFVEELFLPFGPPPIIADIKSELKAFIEYPDNLPIYNVDNIQCYWSREPDILALLNADLAPVGTCIRFRRDPITGKIGDMLEVTLQGTGENAKNSMLMTRAPGPPAEGVRGNTSNFLFWPGGFDEAKIIEEPILIDIDFERNLETLAKGFKCGMDFETDNYTPKNVQFESMSQMCVKECLEQVNCLDLMVIIDKEANSLDFWAKPVLHRIAESKSEEKISTNIDDILSSIDTITKPVANPKLPVLKITEEGKSFLQAEWAEQLDVTITITDFEKRVMNPAINFKYELDNFQKQAIIKLEEDCNVFVAAHTSAGKTTVAEYAIALSQMHMTRTIYTSPIKALSNQKFREFKEKFDNVGLITGDLQINQTASCLIMTTEILLSMLYCASEVLRDLEYVIFDEVHYINNEDRGHVWEEIVILLPRTVNIVMLSATVPNPLKFANWVGQIKKRKMYVISTVRRPVPLQHYLYVGSNMKTKDSCYLILDTDGQFSMEGWRQANAQRQRELKQSLDKKGMKKFKETKKQNKISLETDVSSQENEETEEIKPSMISSKERAMWIAFLKYLQQQDKLPVVVFALSRSRCDKTADSLQHQNVSLITNDEKNNVTNFFKKSIKRLKGSDAQLPQVQRMQKLLEHGIGIHHSGILPILKEIVELLFQQGLVKMLFATETFAMGVNMPARTVVFDAVRKYDGSKFRALHPTEYIQMAGRAGRRGHDTTGTVMLLCKADVPNFIDLQAMMCGEPQSLESQFKITYSMVLHLRRLSETVSVKDMMRRSFKEASSLIREKQVKANLQVIEETLAKTPTLSPNQEKLAEFYETAMEYLRIWKKLRPEMLSAKRASKNLSEGRVLLISYKNHYNKLALLLDKRKQNENILYKILILTSEKEMCEEEKPDNWYRIIALTKKQLYSTAQVPAHEVLLIDESSILEITNCTIKTDFRCVIADWEKRQIPRFKDCSPGPTFSAVVQELLKLSQDAVSNPEDLLPYTEMIINKIDLKPEEKKLKKLKHILNCSSIIQVNNLEEQFGEAFYRKELEEKKKELLIKLSDEQLRDYPDYINRVNILKDLGYIDQNERVTLKGRVALEMGICELFLTELVFKNILTDWSPAEIAALLSALVFQQRTEEPNMSLNKRLKDLQKIVSDEYEILKTKEMKYNLTPAPPLNFGLVKVVYQWARAESFANIMNLTDVQEGIIVRCIQQLNETLRDVKNAAIIIGNPILKEKMDEASSAIKRDIVFTASLYTQD
ncbi:helicase SKI2W [Leptopilina heterotoma]|uniref:helicase SKI2W n=1 Tax=Leptopilina heterotoma TaxID=63436 RepID=UPI001CA81527|nr:helicase SKI2W [Leptopilina heterotoma]